MSRDERYILIALGGNAFQTKGIKEPLRTTGRTLIEPRKP